MQYILCFIASVILIAVAEKRKKQHERIILSVLALLIPCLLACLRGEYVGRDVRHYVIPMLEEALEAPNFATFFAAKWKSAAIGTMRVASFEYGFSLFVYVISKVFRNLQVLLFFIAAAILVPVYIAFFRNRKNMPAWLAMLAFYLLFYNGTLNLMRQWMGMALLLLSFQMLLEKRPIGTAVFALASLLFHYSCLLVIPVYAVYGVLYLLRNVELSSKIGKKQVAISGQAVGVAVLVLLCLLGVIFAQQLMAVLVGLGFDRFASYLVSRGYHFAWKELLWRLPVLAVFLGNWKSLKKSTPQAAFYLAMVLMDIVVSQLTGINPYTYRIALFFALYLVYGLPNLYMGLKTPDGKGALVCASIVYLVVYWGYLHITMHLHETYPYYTFIR